MGASIMFRIFWHVQQLRPASWEVQRTFNHSQSWETAQKRSDVGKSRQKMINALHGRKKHIKPLSNIMSMQFNTIIRTDPRCTGRGVCNDSIMSTDVIHFPFHRFKTRRLSLQSGQNDTLLFRSCHDI